MSSLHIEHVNVTVSNPRRTAELLSALFGWHIRWQGPAIHDGFTIHVGTDDQYMALYHQPAEPYPAQGFAKGTPLNHIGIVVADLDATEARVHAAGLTTFNHGNYTPGRRFYFLDPDGIEFEIVSYS